MTRTDLAAFIESASLVDTHEHLLSEARVADAPPDVLTDLFANYVTADLVVAGAAPEAVDRLVDGADPDLRARFNPVQPAWERCRHTGYGEAVRLIGRHLYGMDEVSLEGIEAAQASGAAARFRGPGKRLEMLRAAGIEHVQVDEFSRIVVPDVSGPEFFLYDLSWASFCSGDIRLETLHAETGVEVVDLESIRAAMERVFAKSAPFAIAVKSQHAYNRTLLWLERSDADAATVLARVVAGQPVGAEERCVLGDWCMARGVELAIRYDLPFKIHAGYYAGYGKMPVERIRSGHLCALLARYPKARFVLMHTSYPYGRELTAIAKHYPNVWLDLCWAWSIDPHATTDFVRDFIHTVPANKLFGFGGDSFWPAASVAYAIQARRGPTRALQGEIADGLLTEAEALMLAERFLTTNQRECFDVEGTRRNIQGALHDRAPAPAATT